MADLPKEVRGYNDSFPLRRLAPYIQLRQRIIGTVLSSSIAALLWGLDQDTGWRLWSCLTALFLLVVSLASDRWTSDLFRFRSILLLAFVGQTLLIVATGGIESPLTIALPLSVMLISMVSGSRPVVVWTTLYTVGALGALTVIFIVEGSGLVPAFLRNYAAIKIGFLGLLLSMVTVIGGTSAVWLNHRLRESSNFALRWQQQALETMESRHADLIHLSGTLAHELKNPLTAIMGLSTLMLDRSEAQSRDERRLKVLVGEVERMEVILERMLDFSRPTHPSKIQAFRINNTLQDILQLFEGVTRARRITLTSDIDPDATHTVTGDERKIKQVVINVLQNALEAVSSDGAIHLSVQLQQDTVTVHINDDGPGLDPELEDSVFSPGITNKSTGSGLGLTIARAIVEGHDGALSVRNREATRGCSVALTLPLATPEDQEEPPS